MVCSETKHATVTRNEHLARTQPEQNHSITLIISHGDGLASGRGRRLEQLGPEPERARCFDTQESKHKSKDNFGNITPTLTLI